MSEKENSAVDHAELVALRAKLRASEQLLADFMSDRGRALLTQIERASDLAARARRAEVLDGATRLLRHGAFRARMIFEATRSTETGRPLGCLFIDIDEFETFNRKQSYELGDEALDVIGRSLEGLWLARPADRPPILGREAGDCFGVLQPAANPEELEWRAEEIRMMIERMPLGSGRLTASVGGTMFRPGEPVEEMGRRAQRNLEIAKKTMNTVLFE